MSESIGLDESMWHVRIDDGGKISRRQMLLAGSTGVGSLFWQHLRLNAAELKKQQRACILVWLAGGPSQFESWDPKPGTKNGGRTKAISTAVPGIQIAQYWPQMAKRMKDVAVIRSMTNREGAHARATYQLHTGRRPTGALKFPNFGSVVGAQVGDPKAELPNFVSIGRTISSGFLGVRSQPFVVNAPGQPPQNVALQVGKARLSRRLKLLTQQDQEFNQAGAGEVALDHLRLYQQANRMIRSEKLKAFQLGDEPPSVQQSYGSSRFAKGLIVARRLVESGVPFVEVRRGGWDNHRNIYGALPKNAADVDKALAGLIADLKQRELYHRTLVVCMGEFGRTPRINKRGGRDHFPKSFSLVLGGGGVQGGQVIGRTTANGSAVMESPVKVADLFQTFCHLLRVDPDHELTTPSNRPLKIVDGGNVIKKLVGRT